MLLIDNSEPDNIVKLIKQSVPATVSPLNRMHMSDYFFGNCEGKTFQFSRKQAGELVGNIDEAEDQLRDYYEQADYNCQIVEGIISPMPLKGVDVSDHSAAKLSVRNFGAKLYCYTVQPNGHVERGHSFSTITASMLYVWIHRLAMAGITTYYTVGWVETARLLTTIYHNEQKPQEEHSTLKRVIRPRIAVKDADPFLKSMLFLSNAYKLGIGPEKAKAICGTYASVLELATADIDDLMQCEGIGKNTARKILSALGRTV